ncbi:glycosyltransferase family 8 protein [Riemerella anatipestifer]|uniref:glycosyltransferase family 8 protein n=1 Tax=Riemerella anatipestifer TaxID=34085 RepID=UPI0012AD5E88|nr:glycosyltransferase family 8 protein [Riemerella anatipestifer]USL95961.1 glycosyltransferase family 8 protein [Riemerella anatipestifer]
MKKMTDFPIVFTSDDKYIKYTSVTIASIISNANKNFNYRFYILADHISDYNQRLLKEFVSKHKNCCIDFIILTNLNKEQFYVKDYYSAVTYYRFYIPEIFKQYDRVLYLDGDVVVEADISEFTTIDFENNAVIAVQDTKHCNFIKSGGEDWYTKDYFYDILKMNNPEQYFNTGVIAFNLKMMREQCIQDKLFALLEEIKNPKLLDQDILNSVLTRWGGVKFISNKYNFMANIRTAPLNYSYKEVLLSRIKKIFNLNKKEKLPFFIYHFVEAAKPWKSQRPDRMLFYKYLYSIHEVNPPKEFVEEIIKENNRYFSIWWKLFMRYFS